MGIDFSNKENGKLGKLLKQCLMLTILLGNPKME